MNTENKIKEFLQSLFILREGGAWSFGIMHSGLRYGTGRTPQKALEDFIKNYGKGLFQ